MQLPAAVLLFASVVAAVPTKSTKPIGTKVCPDPPEVPTPGLTGKCAPLHCELVRCAAPEFVTVPCWCPLVKNVPGCPQTCCPKVVFQHDDKWCGIQLPPPVEES